MTINIVTSIGKKTQVSLNDKFIIGCNVYLYPDLSSDESKTLIKKYIQDEARKSKEYNSGQAYIDLARAIHNSGRKYIEDIFIKN